MGADDVVTITQTRIAVSTLPPLEVDPETVARVERAIGRYLKAAIGLEEQRLLGLHDIELTPPYSRLLWEAALEVESGD